MKTKTKNLKIFFPAAAIPPQPFLTRVIYFAVGQNKFLRYKLLLFLFVIIPYCFSSPVHGAPSVNSVNGSFTDGAAVSIAGNSLGANSLDFEWVGDDIEQGTLGQQPIWNKWVFNFGPNTITYSYAHSGTKSLYNSLNSGTYAAVMRYNYGSQISYNKDIFMSWWVRRIHVGDGQWKLFRVSFDNDIQDTATPQFKMFNWYNGNQFFINSGPGTDATDGCNGCGIRYPGDNAWYRLDVEVKTSSAHGAGGGIYKYSMYDPENDQQVYSITFNDVVSFNDDNDYYQWFMWQNYIGNGITSQETWTDDMFIQVGSWARTELCDSSSWNTRTQCEIQIPSAWSDSSITFTANQGSFNNGDTAYLFVVDENGEVNASGYPITIGESSFDITAPNAPTNLSVL